MKNLPRVLVIDDDYGVEGEKHDMFCSRAGLNDVTGSMPVCQPVADAVFLRGQVKRDGKVKNDLEGTLDAIRKGWEQYPRWSLVFLDLHFKTGKEEERITKDYFGLTILKELYRREEFRDIPIIILSAMEREQIEQQFADHGALDFIDKAEMNREIMKSLLFTHGLVEAENAIGRSLSFLKCLREARRRAVAGNENILLLGETGTGKELLAEYIHRQSGRKGLFNPLFTRGVPETLIEDRLFGHIKGAFDGARSNQAGAAELANKGTLFIDEFGNIPSSTQERLLRLLDKNIREVQRLGSQEREKLDLLLLMATNRMDILSGDNFRGDILYRAKAGTPVVLPPLRERKKDIVLLAEFFVSKFEKSFGANTRTISNEAKQVLLSFDWPGNVRELEGVIEYAVYNYKGLKVLSANHLVLDEKPSDKQEKVSLQIQDRTKDILASTIVTSEAQPPNAFDLHSLIELLTDFSFSHLPKEEIKGKLPVIQVAYSRFLARYLSAALKATLSYSSQNPGGEISYHPAMKLITNDFEMKATPAKRLLNNLLKISPDAVLDLLDSDPVLKKTVELFGDDKLKRQLEALKTKE